MRISGRVTSEPPIPSDAARQLLGRHHHPDVVRLAARREAVVLLRHRQPEAADLGQSRDDRFGDVGVGAMHVLGRGPDLVLGETPERVGDQLEVRAEVGRTRAVLRALVGERFEEGGGAVRRDEVVRGCEESRIDPPEVFSADHPAHDVGDRVGHERAGQHRLDFAVPGVAAHDPPGFDRGGGVGQVVRDHLVLVELVDRQLGAVEARLREVRDRGVDDFGRHGDGRPGRPFLIGAHARTIPTGSRAGRMRVRRRPTAFSSSGARALSWPPSNSVPGSSPWSAASSTPRSWASP